ncbi:MAG: diadenylate cyclase CdaA [Candidatus Peregrinibacteria bacterium]|nr:diadenylate cyclase CdaA [Candidatus Peregrinibacteria bacterium]MDZ4244442.1 diadenylate cyclase CdaA [Candidatus Gracilibacteria bacterium]
MEILGQILAKAITFISDQVINAWQTINYMDISMYQIFVDIFVVTILFYWIIQLVRGTKAKQILTGLALLGFLYIISRAFNLIALEWLLRNFFTVVLIAIPIIFQEEIRRGLQRIGETKFLSSSSHVTHDVIKEIVHATFEMAEKRHGALIVFKKEVSLEEYESTGIEMDAKVTSPLIESVFNPKAPLHDGAVIIHGNKLKYAACILPQSVKKFDKKFGTRHKAAMTLSEYTDSVIIVVSEERKVVSGVYDGEIYEDLEVSELTNFLKNNL